MSRGLSICILVISFSYLQFVLSYRREDSFFARRWSGHHEDSSETVNFLPSTITNLYSDTIKQQLLSDAKNISTDFENRNRTQKTISLNVASTTTNKPNEPQKNQRCKYVVSIRLINFLTV